MVGSAHSATLALDVPIESLVGSSARLRNSFGLKSQEDVAKFFGTMNAQATAAGTTFERSARQFMTFQDSFGHMSSKGAGAFSGLSAAFAASSKDPEQAIRNQSFGMGVLNSGVRQIEHRMGKGFSITNTETGEVDPKKYLEAMKFLQKDMVKYYGSKKRAIQVQAGDDLEARRDVGFDRPPGAGVVVAGQHPHRDRDRGRLEHLELGRRHRRERDRSRVVEELGLPHRATASQAPENRR